MTTKTTPLLLQHSTGWQGTTNPACKSSVVQDAHTICSGLGLGQGTSASHGAQPHPQLSQHHHQAPLGRSSPLAALSDDCCNSFVI